MKGARHWRAPITSGRHAKPTTWRPARALAGLFVVVMILAMSGSRRPPSDILLPAHGAWWGIYVPADGNSFPQAVKNLEAQVGRRFNIVYRYHDMSNTPANGQFPTPGEKRVGRDHMLLFSWSTSLWSAHSHYNWAQVASGALDRSVIDPEARRLAAYRRRVFLTFDPEADSQTPAKGTPAQYVAAWRHIYDRFQALGADNVVWVWTTTGYLGDGHGKTIAAMYPGAAYVDWIGYDPYNFYTCHNTGWVSFQEMVSPFYNWLMAHGYDNKPFMLPEYSTDASPGKPSLEASWYAGILQGLRSHPNIRALVQWDSNVPTCDLRLTNGPGALRAFAAVGHSHYLNPGPADGHGMTAASAPVKYSK